ncbi:M13-type metalloendopeptidase [Sphingosinicella sp. YJ22]|uniref:M13 family metallopeptidase n=1 Tax=Sphingosinicella sp. YJ22 TaxID=1104780 RepID=UPI001FB0379C|nr:M13-type metalloendopeptidase [Sphingosinicella sp. YJ22]
MRRSDAGTTVTRPGGSTDRIASQRMGVWGFDASGMDRNVRPGADFFAFANGNWARTTQIPADRSSFGSFNVLRDLSEARVRQLVENYRVNDSNADRAKVATLYGSFMDEARVERLGARPLQPHLQQIRAAQSKDQIAALMGRSMSGPGASFFSMGVNDDSRDPEHYALGLRQSGLGLPDRDYYLEERFAPQKARYQQYVAQMLGLAGWEQPEQAAAAIVALETEIARAHWSRAESRDRDRTYNPMTPSELQAQAPGFPWATFFRAAGVDHAERAIVAQNTAVPRLAEIFANADVGTLRAWQAFHTVEDAAPLLSRQFVDAQFDFRSRFLQGQPQQRELWKRAVAFAEDAMGEAIGRDYVELYYTPEAQRQMAELVANLRTAMRSRLENLDWMTPATKREALAKLETFTVRIGHPDEWRDYSALEVRPGDLFGNALRSRAFEWGRDRRRIGQDVERGEWGMTPQTVNAYYNPPRNEIVFPAAILQPPFFDPQADSAINYGAIGGVIGHEIIHGFDDQGRKSDGRGVLRDWWTPENAAAFEVQAARLGAQYEAVEFPQLPGQRINGRVAMGENIGDLGGLTIAYEAYRNSLNGREAPVIDGFTGDQRFFLAWAQVWRTLFRDDALRQQLATGPHSPGMIRAYAPLRNIDAWYRAFDIQPSDPLYIPPEQRVRIW